MVQFEFIFSSEGSNLLPKQLELIGEMTSKAPHVYGRLRFVLIVAIDQGLLMYSIQSLIIAFNLSQTKGCLEHLGTRGPAYAAVEGA